MSGLIGQIGAAHKEGRSAADEDPPGEKSRDSQKLLTRSRNFGSNLRGVMKKVLAAFFLGVLAFGPALAADDPAKVKVPDFVPFVVDQQQYQAALNYLNGLTFKDALPLVRWLNEQEERAKGQWEADNRPKAAEPPK